MKYEGVIGYTGNKSKLIPMLNDLFDKSGCDRLVDCCSGGLSVTLHSNFNTVLSNDVSKPIVDMYKFMESRSYDYWSKWVNNMISSWKLSNTNKDAYLLLRDMLNDAIKRNTIRRHILLYTAHCYSFSNMIRFNNSGHFDVPFGQRRFNKNTDKKLKQFFDIIETKDITFSNESFTNLDIKDNDLVYIDPPYLITEAVYNKGWTEEWDKIMMTWLDMLNVRGVKFVMSNVTHHRGKINQKLIDWSTKYNVHSKDHKYVSNAYQAKDMNKKTIEVMIYNF
jgi:DNA adenine methylase